jgi:serine/threonine protein kinase
VSADWLAALAIRPASTIGRSALSRLGIPPYRRQPDRRGRGIGRDSLTIRWRRRGLTPSRRIRSRELSRLLSIGRARLANRYYPAVLNNGEMFAGYRIVRPLGAGGMGEVYPAQHPRLSRLDAIKVLPATLTADNDFADSFRREADLTASLWHPRIVGVQGCGEFDDNLWISMEYVDGTDAAHVLAAHREGIGASDAIDMLDPIADALDFAHHRGLLHRDGDAEERDAREGLRHRPDNAT